MNKKSLDPKVKYLFFFQQLVGLAILLPLLFSIFFTMFIDILGPALSETSTVASNKFLTPFILISLGFLIYSYIMADLRYRFYKYQLSDNGFQKESGVIRKKYTTIPYSKIQNVDINRGLFSRILGLSELQIQTAGAGASSIGEGKIPGISHDTALELRDQLIKLTTSRV